MYLYHAKKFPLLFEHNKAIILLECPQVQCNFLSSPPQRYNILSNFKVLKYGIAFQKKSKTWDSLGSKLN